MRPFAVNGITHKIRIPTSSGDCAFYVTINKIDGKPYELFVNCKNADYAEHMAAITIMISGLLQNGVPLAKIVENLKCVHSPVTGHYDRDKWCPSLYAKIGQLLEI